LFAPFGNGVERILDLRLSFMLAQRGQIIAMSLSGLIIDPRITAPQFISPHPSSAPLRLTTSIAARRLPKCVLTQTTGSTSWHESFALRDCDFYGKCQNFNASSASVNRL
jgi:hypothetical protein